MKALEVTREVTQPPCAPWRNLINIHIEVVELEKKKDEYSKEELRAKAMEKIDSIEADYKIYTDGSTDGDQEYWRSWNVRRRTDHDSDLRRK